MPYDPRPVDMRPMISGQRAFQITPATPIPHFFPEAGPHFYAMRVYVAAGTSTPVVTQSTPVLYVLIYNPAATGASIFYAESGPNPNAPGPIANQISTSAGAELEAGLGVRVDIDDLAKLQLTSAVNAVVSITAPATVLQQ